MNSSMPQNVEFAPCMIAIAGAPYHGKSSVLRLLGEHSNLQIIDVDEIRNSLPKSRKLQTQSFGGLEHGIMVTAYSTAVEFARRFIGAKMPVAIAGTFSRPTFKAPLHAMCCDLGQYVPFHCFRLNVSSLDVILQRIEERKIRGEPTTVDNIDLYKKTLSFQGAWWEEANLQEIESDSTSAEDIAIKIINHCNAAE